MYILGTIAVMIAVSCFLDGIYNNIASVYKIFYSEETKKEKCLHISIHFIFIFFLVIVSIFVLSILHLEGFQIVAFIFPLFSVASLIIRYRYRDYNAFTGFITALTTVLVLFVGAVLSTMNEDTTIEREPVSHVIDKEKEEGKYYIYYGNEEKGTLKEEVSETEYYTYKIGSCYVK